MNKYDTANIGEEDKVCFSINVQQAGNYRVHIYGGRHRKGRKPFKCNEMDKAGSIEVCEALFNTTCVCKDLENDVWSIVPGVLTAEGDAAQFS